MKIAIFSGEASGRSRFSQAMTLTLAVELTKQGFDTQWISSGDWEKRDFEFQRLVQRIAAGVEIRSIQSHVDMSFDCDWMIVTTNRLDLGIAGLVVRSAREQGVRTTKSFPRLLGMATDKNRELCHERLQTFDLLGFSLFSDYERACQAGIGSGVEYVPRGFLVEYLLSDVKAKKRCISVEAPVKPLDSTERVSSNTSMAPVGEVLDRVKREFGDLILITSRLPGWREDCLNLGSLSLLEFYDQFVIPASIMLWPPIQSTRLGRWLGDGFQGMYENQAVEAQIAGVVPVAETGWISTELLHPSLRNVSVVDWRDTKAVFEKVVQILESDLAERLQMSRWAQESHSSKRMVQLWISAMRRFDSCSK